MPMALSAVHYLAAIRRQNRVGAVNSPSTPPIYILKSRRHKTVKYSSSNIVCISFMLNFGYKNQVFYIMKYNNDLQLEVVE